VNERWGGYYRLQVTKRRDVLAIYTPGIKEIGPKKLINSWAQGRTWRDSVTRSCIFYFYLPKHAYDFDAETPLCGASDIFTSFVWPFSFSSFRIYTGNETTNGTRVCFNWAVFDKA